MFAQFECVDAMAETLCIPQFELELLSPDNPESDGDACHDVVVTITGLPATCTCDFHNIIIDFERDSDGDGIYETIQNVGTFVWQTMSFVPTTFSPLFVGPIQNQLGGFIRTRGIHVGGSVTFDVYTSAETINVSVCVDVDCDQDGMPDCVVCEDEEIFITCH